MTSITPRIETFTLPRQKAKVLPSICYEKGYNDWVRLRSHEIEGNGEGFYSYYASDVRAHIGAATAGFNTSEKARDTLNYSAFCWP